MVKVCEKEYPMGSFPGQKTPGFYMDGTLKENINIYAKKIINDMQFVGCCSSSTFEVRTGKSTFVQQIGKYYTEKVNEFHGLGLTFDEKNIVFKAKKMQERALELKKCSILILDEGDDLTAHYFSKIARDLRRFFRKCGQLNLFIILILPDFFELPKPYAISRSNFLIDVKFEGDFQRGFFEFYSFRQKKWLYIKGKKNYDWDCVTSSFSGRFPKLYIIDEKIYRKMKKEDLEEDNDEEGSSRESKYIFQRNVCFKIMREKGMKYVEISNEMKQKGVQITNKGISDAISTLENEK